MSGTVIADFQNFILPIFQDKLATAVAKQHSICLKIRT